MLCLHFRSLDINFVLDYVKTHIIRMIDSEMWELRVQNLGWKTWKERIAWKTFVNTTVFKRVLEMQGGTMWAVWNKVMDFRFHRIREFRG